MTTKAPAARSPALRRLLTLALASAATLATWTLPATAMQAEEAEALFHQSMSARAHGDLENAEAGLRRLLAESPTSRVRLELARVLLESGQNAESYRLFKEVNEDPSVPAAVKSNMRPFMERAELRSGRIRYGVSLTSDSNPYKTSEGGTIYFAGIPFEYQPPKEKKTSYGVEPWVTAERLWNDRYIGRARLSGRIFEDDDLNSAGFHGSLGMPVPGVDFAMVQAAVDGRADRDSHSFLPSVEAWKRIPVSLGSEVGLGGQAGYLFSSNEAASGPYLRPYAFASAALGPNLTGTARLSVERLTARNSYYSYTTPKIDLGLNWQRDEWRVSPRIEISRSFYDDFDVFWNVKRQDTTIRPSITVSNDRIAWKDFVPEATISYERRDSNIFIHSYSQFGGFLNLRRRF